MNIGVTEKIIRDNKNIYKGNFLPYLSARIPPIIEPGITAINQNANNNPIKVSSKFKTVFKYITSNVK